MAAAAAARPSWERCPRRCRRRPTPAEPRRSLQEESTGRAFETRLDGSAAGVLRQHGGVKCTRAALCSGRHVRGASQSVRGGRRVRRHRVSGRCRRWLFRVAAGRPVRRRPRRWVPGRPWWQLRRRRLCCALRLRWWILASRRRLRAHRPLRGCGVGAPLQWPDHRRCRGRRMWARPPAPRLPVGRGCKLRPLRHRVPRLLCLHRRWLGSRGVLRRHGPDPSRAVTSAGARTRRPL